MGALSPNSAVTADALMPFARCVAAAQIARIKEIVNPALVGLIGDAIELLDDSEQALNDAKATTNPLTRTDKLLDAIAWHEDTITTLKKSVFLYRDGVQKINSKFSFDFYKTVEQQTIDKQLSLLDAVEASSDCDPECLAAIVVTVFGAAVGVIVTGLSTEIRAVVGNEFSAANLTLGQLIARAQYLDTIEVLRDEYGVNLIGPNALALSLWMSNPTSDLFLIDQISEAVQIEAMTLSDFVGSWDLSDGLLRPNDGVPTNPSDYLISLQAATTPQSVFKIVSTRNSASFVAILANSRYQTDTSRLFGFLNGQEYAKFARAIIEIDRDLYDATRNITAASRLWSTRNWLPTSSRLLRTDWSSEIGFTTPSGLTPTIDPTYSLAQNSPRALITSWRTWVANTNPPLCSEDHVLCPETANCYVEAAYTSTSNASDLEWCGAPRSDYWLPFFPTSILTGCIPARRSFARGTIALWSEFGILESIESIVRWVNTLEHGAYFNEDTAHHRAARIDLMQYLHSVYFRTQPDDRLVEYIAGMSSAIFEYDNVDKVDHRTYLFLSEILTLPDEYVFQVTGISKFALENYDIDWNTYNTSLYSTRIQNAVAAGATATFGSTEFNNLSDEERRIIIRRYANISEGWVDYISGIEPAENPASFDPESPTAIPDLQGGVFLMTAAQLGFVYTLVGN